MAFSICSLFWRTYAINACGSLGKIKTQKNPAIKDWIAENKKNGRGCFNCSENISQAQNGCELIENAHRFVILRKYLCFQRFLKQRKIFCSTERTFSPKQTQDASENSCTSDFFPKGIQRSEVRLSLLLEIYNPFHAFIDIVRSSLPCSAF